MRNAQLSRGLDTCCVFSIIRDGLQDFMVRVIRCFMAFLKLLISPRSSERMFVFVLVRIIC